jgi:GGDEF domain-containing protein
VTNSAFEVSDSEEPSVHLESLTEGYADTRPTSPPLPVVGWCTEARQDAITGLVAFPDFNFYMPEILAFCESHELDLGIAIGDVDDLKEYVENSKSTDAAAYGHMAGCALMQALGASAAEWFGRLDTSFGCLSTFGGDEIIVALAVERGADDGFEAQIVALRDHLFGALPRSVSFGWTVAHLRDGGAGPAGRDYYRSKSTVVLSAVDQALFRQKATLRQTGLRCEGFVTKARPTCLT